MGVLNRRFDVMRWMRDIDSRLDGAITIGARERLSPIEDWHVVGELDEPKFFRYPAPNYEGAKPIRYSPWQGEGYAPPAFFRDTAGVVHLRGAVETGGPQEQTPTIFRSGGSGAFFQLPLGYRPKVTQQLDRPLRWLQDDSPSGGRMWDVRPIQVVGETPSYSYERPGDVGFAGAETSGQVGPSESNFVILDGISFLTNPTENPAYNPDLGIPPWGY